ncbi:hypothetical protein [Microbacterium kyungheense]|jgi:hypothetical protein|uniref:Uncharacterized protein n=1 Tax=Microbacterium kyungheense TaxID=1263636 RepID=A0A543EQ28_9MICO|nr:hypothetical protein [Microbacterium kyungheense]TQM23680.1 hypothetical protein FB391_3070 [Microbacterium kyungheense]
MSQHAHDSEPGWTVRWTSPERGEWTADLHGMVVGEVHRDADRYIATRGARTLGRYRSLDAALEAVDHRSLTAPEPNRLWTLLLTTINVGIVAAIALVATMILR